MINQSTVKKNEKNFKNPYRLNDNTVLLNYEEASKIYKSIKPKKLGPEDAILLLLAITPDKPIKGKTMMIKQLFLIEKEVIKQIQDLKFIGHKYGPHSFLMENILKNMEFIGLINNVSNRYKITEKGMKKIKPLMAQMDNDILQKLKNYRISWDELGNEGIINLVYDKYPQFTNNSIIKHRYQIINWDKENENRFNKNK